MFIATVESFTTAQSQLSCHMKKYQEFLEYEYESLELISPLEMLDCFSTQYINLTLVRKKKEDNYVPQKGKICDDVTLTEALDVEAHKKKVVSIVGGPGMGKVHLLLTYVSNGQKVIYYKTMMLSFYCLYVIQRYKGLKILRICY